MSFGIYIKTFKPDYHLAKALISSIRTFTSDTPIIIIPDDDFTKASLWGYEALVLRDSFSQSLRGYYKKLWAFLGPFDRFLYLDADMLCLRDPKPLLDWIQTTSKPFFGVCRESKIRLVHEGEDNEQRLRICQDHIGDANLLKEFDPNYSITKSFPFNSGLFASTRDYLPPESIQSVFDSACHFQKQKDLPDLRFTRRGLFMGDQGFLNYLTTQHEAELTYLNDAFVWGGRKDAVLIDSQNDATDPFANMFVHWAGCPRPCYFNTEVPWGTEWKVAYSNFLKTKGLLSEMGCLFYQWRMDMKRRIRQKLKGT